MQTLKRTLKRHAALAALLAASAAQPALAGIADAPLFLVQPAKPKVMFAMSVDHQLFKKAYPDYNDVDGDGVIDITYTDTINYYGYFDSNRCYEYDSGRFEPEGVAGGANGHDCPASDEWSGNFLNWATMTRIDVLRKVLHGGRRYIDTATDTVLERAHLPSDVHAFAKGYVTSSTSEMLRFTPFSRTEITLCNVTAPPLSGETQTVDRDTYPPQLRVADGLYLLWASDERNQCLWDGGEDVSSTTKNPPESANLVNSGARTGLNVRVQVCVPGKLEENCESYGAGYKPTGLLQEYGEDGSLDFGMVSGSYGQNHRGGVLRRALGQLANNPDAADNEILAADGTFNAAAEGIISTLNNVRINRWNSTPGGVYNDCSTYGISKSTFLGAGYTSNRKCSVWGNPVAEIYLETLRYLAGDEDGSPAPHSDYIFSGSDYYWETSSSHLDLPVLQSWTDPIPEDEWCAPLNVVLISSADNSFDTDNLTDVPSSIGSIASAVDQIGSLEGISGSVFAGLTGDATDDAASGDQCTAKAFTSLSNVRGVCPTAPALEGGYHVAGLAYKAHTVDFRDSLDADQRVDTFVIALAKELPELSFPAGGGKATAVPVCGANTNGGASLGSSGWTPCTLADVMVRETAVDGNGALSYVRLLAVWEDSLWGNDYDSDGISQIAVCVGSACAAHDDDGDGATDDNYDSNGDGSNDATIASGQVRVTARVVSADAGNALRFGFSISGTTNDGLYDTVYRRGGRNGSVLVANEPTAIRPGSYTAADWSDPLVMVFDTGTTAARTLPNPLLYAAKYGGFEDENDSGTPDDPAEWDADGDGLPDNYFFADNPGELGPKLAAFLADVADSSSSASVVANAAVLDTNTRIYQAQFNSDGWFGHLYSYPVSLGTGQVLPAEWDAATIISAQDPDTGREILSWRPTDGTGVAFRWASDETYLSTGQKALLGIHPSSGLSDGLGEDRLLYVRGNEISGFRSRMEEVNGVEIKNVFGDIVHSTPALVGAPNSGYPDSIEPSAPYSAFKSLYASRASMLYVGGNDGMLHAIDATPVTGGQEKLAYVPNGVLAKLPQLTLTNYNHKYFVDGPPTVVDAYLGTSWKTVLVSGLGAGGRSVFALDVTDPTTFNESNAANLVLWEIDNTTTGFSDLGHTFSQPAIFKEQGSGSWVAAFGNGFGGSKAVLYFVDLANGTLLRSIELDTTAGNGLATIAPVDRDKNGMVDLIYAGDLKGNVWRLEVGATGFSSAGASLLYVAKDAAGNRQSITTRVDVGAHPFSGTGRMVYIGTGTYYLDTDNEPGTQANTVYGVWDKDDGATVTSVTTRSGDISLLKQEVELTPTLYGVSTRVVSDNSMDWSTQSGWFLDLPTTGERMASNMTLRAGRLIFVTTIPSSAPCESGGSSWLMEINAATGGRLYETVFDLDGDGTFDVGDMVDTDGDGNADTEISGRKFDSIVQNPSIIRAGQGSESAGGYKEYKYLSSSDGSIKQVTESTPLTSGRKSWLQIQ